MLLEERPASLKVIQSQARGTTSREAWLPRSQVDYMRKLGRDSKGQMEIVVEIPEWLAIEKGLESE